ncbi:hypothetical protein NQ318_003115 [Aromia moschata]|uniref:Ig-like domain-containing protein n=1 Tax=Aromia moschata TaxID=1265417 RepID=A0AAV8YUJ2_9CUCU|nr:hypothetical protein NQ318_003115 [Aromia moschata]
MKYREGTELRLSGRVEAYPIVGVMWYRNGRLVNYIRVYFYPCIPTPLTDPSRCPGTHVCAVVRQSHVGTLDRSGSDPQDDL